MRRSVGISSLQSQQSHSQAFQSLSSQISSSQIDNLKAQMDQFRSSLREFAVKHREEIRKDPVFRMHFQRMCSTLSIDPLSGPLHPSSSSPSSIWSSILNLSDWTYELSIQIIDISISTLPLNGGLLPLPDLIRRISFLRGIPLAAPSNASVPGGITEDDIRRAVATLGPLGSGVEIITLPGSGPAGNRKALRRGGLGGGGVGGGDEASLIGLAMSKGGRLVPSEVARELGWRLERVRAVLMEEMVERQGVAWVDEQAWEEEEGGRVFWIGGVVEWGE